MATVVFGGMGGANLSRSEFLLAHGEGALAENMSLRRGKAAPFSGVRKLRDLAAAAESVIGFGGEFLTFAAAAEGAETGRRGAHNDLMVSGAGIAPRIYSSENPTDGKRLGCPWVPVAKPPTISGSPQTNAEARTQVFAMAVVLADGTESPLAVYDPVSIAEGQSVAIGANLRDNTAALSEEFLQSHEGVVVPPALESRAIQYIRYYRAETGGRYLKLEDGDDAPPANYADRTEIPNKIFAANARTIPTAAQFVGERETRPRLNMRGIGIHPLGFAFGFADNILCFSAAGQFGVWPRSYEIVIPEGRILAVREWNNNLIIFPELAPPLTARIVSPTGVEIHRSESSFAMRAPQARTAVNMGRNGIWYATDKGIAQVGGGLLTDGLLDDERAARQILSTMDYAFADGDEYFGVSDEGILCLTPRTAAGRLSLMIVKNLTLDGSAAGRIVSSTPHNGKLACLHRAQGDVLPKISVWREGAPLRYRWRSRRMRLTDLGDPAVVWVFGGAAGENAANSVWTSSWRDWWLGPSAGALFYASANNAGDDGFFVGNSLRPNSGLEWQFARRDTLGEDNADLSSVMVRVYTQNRNEATGNGPYEVVIDSAANTGDTFNSHIVDCLRWLPGGELTGWLQLEISGRREIDMFGVYGDLEHFLGVKQRSPIMPAAGG